MYKVGDKVIVIDTVSKSAREHYGEIVTVTKVYTDFIMINDYEHGMWNNDVKLFKPKPISELDFLDCFKANFSEGV